MEMAGVASMCNYTSRVSSLLMLVWWLGLLGAGFGEVRRGGEDRAAAAPTPPHYQPQRGQNRTETGERRREEESRSAVSPHSPLLCPSALCLSLPPSPPPFTLSLPLSLSHPLSLWNEQDRHTKDRGEVTGRSGAAHIPLISPPAPPPLSLFCPASLSSVMSGSLHLPPPLHPNQAKSREYKIIHQNICMDVDLLEQTVEVSEREGEGV